MHLSHGNTIISFSIIYRTNGIGLYCYPITYYAQNSDQYILLLLYYYAVVVDVQTEDFLCRYNIIIIITIYQRV